MKNIRNILPKKEKLLQYAVVALVFSLPFERIPSVAVAGFTLKVSVVLSVFVIMLSLLADTKLYKRLPTLYVAVSFWIIWVSLRLTTVTNQKEALKLYIPWVLLAATALAIGRASNYISWRLVWRALLIASAVVGIYGLFQFVGDSAGLPSWLTSIRPEYAADRFGFPRLHSTLLEPLFFGNFMLLPIAICSYFLSRPAKEKPLSQKYLLGVLLLLITTDLLTVSRGALAALVFEALAIAALFLITKSKLNLKTVLKKGLLGVMVAVLVVIVSLSVLSKQGNDTDNTYESKGLGTWVRHLLDSRLTPNQENIAKDDSIAQRAGARKQAIALLNSDKRYWLIGTGPGQYQNLEIQKYGFTAGDANVALLMVVVHVGLIGLLLVAAIFAITLWYAWLFLKSKDTELRALGFVVTAYLLAWNVQALTFGSIAIAHLWFMIGLVLAVRTKMISKA